jgi:hypothetical protein
LLLSIERRRRGGGIGRTNPFEAKRASMKWKGMNDALERLDRLKRREFFREVIFHGKWERTSALKGTGSPVIILGRR